MSDIKSIFKDIQSKFGKEAVVLASVEDKVSTVARIPTGSVWLDYITQGGLPKGRVIELFGVESGGKSTLALSICANVQKRGGIVAYIDAEHALDNQYVHAVGCDLNNMLISQPDSGEQALELVEFLVNKNVDLVVVDSVASLVPQAELDGEIGDVRIGAQARMMSSALRRITPKSKVSSILFINQLRDKIGVMFGNKETTPGGKALKFHASMRIEIRKGSSIKNKDTVIGNLSNVKVVKNKCGIPYTSTQIPIIFGKGIDVNSEISTMIKECGDFWPYLDEHGVFMYDNTILGNTVNDIANKLASFDDTYKNKLASFVYTTYTHKLSKQNNIDEFINYLFIHNIATKKGGWVDIKGTSYRNSQIADLLNDVLKDEWETYNKC